MLSYRLRAAISAAWLLAAACGDLDAAPDEAFGAPVRVPQLALPEPTGIHRLGRLPLLWTDGARDRTLPVWLYYPTQSRNDTPELVLPDSLWGAVHQSELAATLGPAAAEALSALRTSATTNAAIETTGTRFPVLIFAPGRGMLPTDYSALIEEVVSHGFVVVSFAPPGDGATVRFADGTTVVGDEPSCRRVADDITFLRRRLVVLEHDATWLFAGRLDLAHIAVFGHGTGGSAALLAAARDTALVAAVSLDGDFLGEVARGGVHQPLLYLSTQPPGLDSVPVAQWAKVDRAERRREEFWDGVAANSFNAVHARVAGMYDGNISDAGLLPPSAVQGTRRQMRAGPIDPRRGFVLAGETVVEFVTDAITRTRRGIDAVMATFPEVTLSR